MQIAQDEAILVSEVDLQMEVVVEVAGGLTGEGSIQTDAPSLTTSQTQTSEEVPVELLRISIDQFKGDPEASNCTQALKTIKHLLMFLPLGPAAYHLNYLYGKSSINVENQLF